MLGSRYGISAEEIKNISAKVNAGEKLTAEEQKKLTTYRSEMGATMAEHLLGNERVIRKLVLEREPLVERVLGKLESFKNTLTGNGEKYSLAEKRRIDKALKLYLKAAEASGKTRLANRIRAMLKDEEKENAAENEHLSTLSAENPQKEPLTNINQGNMSVSNSEVKFSKKVTYGDNLDKSWGKRYNLYTATDDFIREVAPKDRKAFSRSLANKTSGMAEGEIRNIYIYRKLPK